MEESSFDKKGFVFFLKFATFLFFFVFASKYGWLFIVDEIHFSKDSQTQEIRQIASIVALKQSDKPRQEALIPVLSPKKLSLGFVGDIMLDRGVKESIDKNGNGSYIFAFEKLKDYLKNFDILFGNLEGPISNGGIKSGSVYSFRMEPQSAQALKEAGFDVLSVANNHMGDWGKIAIKDTLQNLKDAEIVYSGGGNSEKEAYEAKMIEIDETKIAYLSFSQFGKGYLEAREGLAGIAVISDDKIKSSIEKAEAENDIVVVSFHFGDEYKKEPNDYQKAVARGAIDYGADLVVGHHAHVVGPIEKYKERYIAYGLGNFVFDQPFSTDTMEGMVLEATVEDKKITAVSADKIVINKYYQPELVAGSFYE